MTRISFIFEHPREDPREGFLHVISSGIAGTKYTAAFAVLVKDQSMSSLVDREPNRKLMGPRGSIPWG